MMPQLNERPKPLIVTPPSTNTEGLEAFNTETSLERHAADKAARRLSIDKPRLLTGAMVKSIAVALAATAVAVTGLWAYQTRRVDPTPASLSLHTTPSGAQVLIDGTPSGVTPVSLALAPGKYRVTLLGANGRTRDLDVALSAGASVTRDVEWAETPDAVRTSGTLHIQTDPPGRTVVVDDTARGVSPLTVTGLSAGEHNVVVTGSEGSFRRQVTIAAGETLSLVVAANAPAMSGGWLRVISPVPLQLRANGKFIGSTEAERLMLPSGDYDIEMVNESLGFASKQRVKVAAGKTADVRVTPPNGRLNINAVPWAEVWVGGERVGETPIANLSRSIGTHDVVLRHPQFGERRLRVTVSLKETARVGVDMRQP